MAHLYENWVESIVEEMKEQISNIVAEGYPMSAEEIVDEIGNYNESFNYEITRNRDCCANYLQNAGLGLSYEEAYDLTGDSLKASRVLSETLVNENYYDLVDFAVDRINEKEIEEEMEM